MILAEDATTVAAEISRLYAKPGLSVVVPESLSKVWIAVRGVDDSARRLALTSAFQLTFEQRGNRLEVRQGSDTKEPARIQRAITQTWAQADGGPLVKLLRAKVRPPGQFDHPTRGLLKQDATAEWTAIRKHFEAENDPETWNSNSFVAYEIEATPYDVSSTVALVSPDGTRHLLDGSWTELQIDEPGTTLSFAPGEEEPWKIWTAIACFTFATESESSLRPAYELRLGSLAGEELARDPKELRLTRWRAEVPGIWVLSESTWEAMGGFTHKTALTLEAASMYVGQHLATLPRMPTRAAIEAKMNVAPHVHPTIVVEVQLPSGQRHRASTRVGPRVPAESSFAPFWKLSEAERDAFWLRALKTMRSELRKRSGA